VAENSQTSAKKEKQPTGRTSKPTAEQKFSLRDALEILSQAFSIAEDAGAELVVHQDEGSVEIVVLHADFVGGMIVPHKEVPQSGVPQ
jgi:hypothetical protein